MDAPSVTKIEGDTWTIEFKVNMTDLPACPRCRGGHKNVVVKPLTNPIGKKFTHWIICPATGEPVICYYRERRVRRRKPAVTGPSQPE